MSASFCPRCSCSALLWSGRCPTCGIYGQLCGSVLITCGLLIGLFGSLILCQEITIVCEASMVALATIGVMRIIRRHRLQTAARRRMDTSPTEPPPVTPGPRAADAGSTH